MRIAGSPCGDRAAAAAAALLVMGGCAAVKKPTTIEALSEAPYVQPERYVISAGDELEIRFFHTPELNVVLPVRPDGHISLPFAHDVQAAGRTSLELRDELSRSYERELEQPEIAVIVRTFSGQRVHVGGEVSRPGVLALAGRMTVLDAVLASGGMLETARLDEVIVIRATSSGDGYAVVPVNLKHVMNGTDPKQNLALAPYDAIFVPRSPIAELNSFVRMYIKNNIPGNLNFRYNLGGVNE